MSDRKFRATKTGIIGSGMCVSCRDFMKGELVSGTQAGHQDMIEIGIVDEKDGSFHPFIVYKNPETKTQGHEPKLASPLIH